MSCTNRTWLGKELSKSSVRFGFRAPPFLSTSPQYLRSTSCRCPEVRVWLKGKGYAKGLV
jgi:hypothetical protein